MYKKVIFATLFFLLIKNLNASESNILDIDIQNIQYKKNINLNQYPELSLANMAGILKYIDPIVDI
jgi:hypothetical protein